MRKSLIALAALSTFVGAAYAQSGTGPQSTSGSGVSTITVSSDSSGGGTTTGQPGQDGVTIVAEMSPVPVEVACGCYSPPGSCSS